MLIFCVFVKGHVYEMEESQVYSLLQWSAAVLEAVLCETAFFSHKNKMIQDVKKKTIIYSHKFCLFYSKSLYVGICKELWLKTQSHRYLPRLSCFAKYSAYYHNVLAATLPTWHLTTDRRFLAKSLALPQLANPRRCFGDCK